MKNYQGTKEPKGSLLESVASFQKSIQELLSSVINLRKELSIYASLIEIYSLEETESRNFKINSIFSKINKIASRLKKLKDSNTISSERLKNLLEEYNQIYTEFQLLGYCVGNEETKNTKRKKIDGIPEKLANVHGLDYEYEEGEKSEVFPAITEKELQSIISKIIPPEFTENTLFVCRRPSIDEKEEFLSGLASFDSEKKLLLIEIFDTVYSKEGKGTKIYKILRDEFLTTFFHELGHIAHHFMDLEAMQSWEQLIELDRTAVSWYVEYNRRNKSVEEEKTEDFAETFYLFYVRPALLKLISPSRYEFMGKYIESRLRTSQLIGFKNWLMSKEIKERSRWEIPPEELRVNYLGKVIQRYEMSSFNTQKKKD
jgi:hypothetical protein